MCVLMHESLDVYRLYLKKKKLLLRVMYCVHIIFLLQVVFKARAKYEPSKYK